MLTVGGTDTRLLPGAGRLAGRFSQHGPGEAHPVLFGRWPLVRECFPVAPFYRSGQSCPRHSRPLILSWGIPSRPPRARCLLHVHRSLPGPQSRPPGSCGPMSRGCVPAPAGGALATGAGRTTRERGSGEATGLLPVATPRGSVPSAPFLRWPLCLRLAWVQARFTNSQALLEVTACAPVSSLGSPRRPPDVPSCCPCVCPTALAAAHPCV